MPCEFPEHHGGGGDDIPWWVKAGAAVIVGGEIVHEIVRHARAIEDGFEVAAAILGVTILVVVLGLAAWRIGSRARAGFTEPELPARRTEPRPSPLWRYPAPARQAGTPLRPADASRPATLRPAAVIRPGPAGTLREAGVTGTADAVVPADSAESRDTICGGGNE